MSGGCWNYMNDSAASEILGYHIYVGYGLDSDKHEKNYKQVVRDNPLGDPEISALVYDVFCLLHSYDWAESGDTDMDAYQKDVEIFKSRWFKKARKDRIKEMIDISTEKLISAPRNSKRICIRHSDLKQKAAVNHEFNDFSASSRYNSHRQSILMTR